MRLEPMLYFLPDGLFLVFRAFGDHILDGAAVFFDIYRVDLTRVALQPGHDIGLLLLIEHEKFVAGHFPWLDLLTGKYRAGSER